MKTYESLFDFRRDLMSAAVPASLTDRKMNVILYGTLNGINDLMISLYSDRAEVEANTLAIVAGALAIYERDRFLEIGQDGRAGKMRLALLRDAGEPSPDGIAWPDPADDPVFD